MYLRSLVLAGYPVNSEAFNFAQQVGAFEIRPAPSQQLASYQKSWGAWQEDSVVYQERLQTDSEKNVSGSQVLQQVMLHAPVHWCPLPLHQPITVIGNYNW